MGADCRTASDSGVAVVVVDRNDDVNVADVNDLDDDLVNSVEDWVLLLFMWNTDLLTPPLLLWLLKLFESILLLLLLLFNKDSFAQ